mmetsp:Transcript_46885/g.123047  ORF Transcript_46885/g.123047 Transcript_46885/m.123047 type:complete len:127 (+) Transcript_46885:986-1366(+)
MWTVDGLPGQEGPCANNGVKRKSRMGELVPSFHQAQERHPTPTWSAESKASAYRWYDGTLPLENWQCPRSMLHHSEPVCTECAKKMRDRHHARYAECTGAFPCVLCARTTWGTALLAAIHSHTGRW